MKTLLKHGVVVTMSERGDKMQVYRDGFLLIEDGVITGLGDSCDTPPLASTDEVVNLNGSVVTPGLINPHAHPAEYMLRDSVPESLRLRERLEYWVKPLYKRLTPDLEASSMVSFLIDSALCGVTTVVAPYVVHPETTLEESLGSGLRLVAGAMINDDEDTDTASNKVWRIRSLADKHKGRVKPVISVFDLSKAGRGLLNLLLKESTRLRWRIVVHFGLGEEPTSHKELLEHDGLVACIVGDVGTGLLHKLAERRRAIVVSPLTNMHIGSGVVSRLPLPELMNAGCDVCVGTCGFSPMDTNVLRLSGLLALSFKDSRYSVRVMNAWQSLSLVTLKAARALGLDGEIGSLDEGKLGDVVVFNPSKTAAPPLSGDPYSYLVYRFNPLHTDYVLVGGSKVVWEGRVVVSTHKYGFSHDSGDDPANRDKL